jgi:NADH-quinone oxidoreductase subunit J
MAHIGDAYFWVCAGLAVLGALATVIAQNPIRGAMGLLLMILAIAGLFLALHAQFLAAIQLIVYAGAIVVLFLFVIMLLGPSAVSPRDNRGRIARYSGAALFGASGAGALALSVYTAGDLHVVRPAANEFGGIDAFGRILFTHGLAPFELSSALLMVAIIGAVAVARGRQADPNAKGAKGESGAGHGRPPGASAKEER